MSKTIRTYANNNDISCSNTTPRTKLEIQHDIKANKAFISRYENYHDGLADMTTFYEFNRNHLYEMIGICVAEVATRKAYIKKLKKELKGLKNG